MAVAPAIPTKGGFGGGGGGGGTGNGGQAEVDCGAARAGQATNPIRRPGALAAAAAALEVASGSQPGGCWRRRKSTSSSFSGGGGAGFPGTAQPLMMPAPVIRIQRHHLAEHHAPGWHRWGSRRIRRCWPVTPVSGGGIFNQLPVASP